MRYFLPASEFQVPELLVRTLQSEHSMARGFGEARQVNMFCASLLPLRNFAGYLMASAPYPVQAHGTRVVNFPHAILSNAFGICVFHSGFGKTSLFLKGNVLQRITVHT